MILYKKQILQFFDAWEFRVILVEFAIYPLENYMSLKYKMCSSSDGREKFGVILALSLSLNHTTDGEQMHFSKLEVRTVYLSERTANNEKANYIVHVGLKIIFLLWCLGFLLKLLFDSLLGELLSWSGVMKLENGIMCHTSVDVLYLVGELILNYLIKDKSLRFRKYFSLLV